MHRSKIEWTDFSGGYANFVWRGKHRGDCEVSPGCAHCYVTRCWTRRPDLWPDETTFFPDKLAKLSRCRPRPNKTMYRRGPDSRPMVFPNDTGDLFHCNVTDQRIVAALDVFYARNDIDWQILTKRADRAANILRKWLIHRGLDSLPPWMWLLFSAEDQQRLDERLPWLAAVPAAVRGFSIEPMLGPVVLPTWALESGILRWIIVGGESGQAARPMHPDWPRQLRDQCERAGCAYFFKQWGRWWPWSELRSEKCNYHVWGPDVWGGPYYVLTQDGRFLDSNEPETDTSVRVSAVGKKTAGKYLDGQLWDQFPSVPEVPPDA